MEQGENKHKTLGISLSHFDFSIVITITVVEDYRTTKSRMMLRFYLWSNIYSYWSFWGGNCAKSSAINLGLSMRQFLYLFHIELITK